MSRCRQGDRGAWRQLYDRHAPLVYRFISALGVIPGRARGRAPGRVPGGVPQPGELPRRGPAVDLDLPDRRAPRGPHGPPPPRARRAERAVAARAGAAARARSRPNARPRCTSSIACCPSCRSRSAPCWCCSRSKDCGWTRSPASSTAPRTRSGRGCTMPGPRWPGWPARASGKGRGKEWRRHPPAGTQGRVGVRWLENPRDESERRLRVGLDSGRGPDRRAGAAPGLGPPGRPAAAVRPWFALGVSAGRYGRRRGRCGGDRVRVAAAAAGPRAGDRGADAGA